MKRIYSAFRSVFYPKACVSCGEIIDETEFLCDFCFEMAEKCDFTKRCSACGLKRKDCECKRKVFHFDRLVSAFVNRGTARRAMYAFKFGRRMTGAEFFGQAMTIAVKTAFSDISFDGICFVPMDLKRQRRRGFNQSELLARQIGKHLGIPVFNALRAGNKLRSQHMLTEKQRFKNVKGVYSVVGNMENKRILLVDDIKTTGATLDECARQLLLKGADSVCCVTGLIGERKNKKGKK